MTLKSITWRLCATNVPTLKGPALYAALIISVTSTVTTAALAEAPPKPAANEPPPPPPSLTDAEILGDSPSAVRVNNVEAKMMVFSQAGSSGYQSQAGPPQGPGSERLLVIHPSGLVSFQTSPTAQHTAYASADIVSAASANATDVLTTPSAVNKAWDVEFASAVQMSEDWDFSSSVALHAEEPVRSMAFSLGLERSFAEDNATFGVSGGAVIDHVNNNRPNGEHYGIRNRISVNGNASFSQVLSPTTVLLLGYGYTYQQGTLQTPWQSVPLEGGIPGPAQRGGELFPEQRGRHAAALELAQHVPDLRATFRLNYRFYADTFETIAHSAQLMYYQYLGAHLLLRTHYRFHTQDAVYFFGTSHPQSLVVTGLELQSYSERPWDPAIFQTSDSDLASFQASEAGVRMNWLQGNRDTLDIGYTYYLRTNGLDASIFSVGYIATF